MYSQVFATNWALIVYFVTNTYSMITFITSYIMLHYMLHHFTLQLVYFTIDFDMLQHVTPNF